MGGHSGALYQVFEGPLVLFGLLSAELSQRPGPMARIAYNIARVSRLHHVSKVSFVCVFASVLVW